MLAIDQSGNKLLEFIKITEEDAALQFSPITVCLLVVKIGEDYLMGFNHWRMGYHVTKEGQRNEEVNCVKRKFGKRKNDRGKSVAKIFWSKYNGDFAGCN